MKLSAKELKLAAMHIIDEMVPGDQEDMQAQLREAQRLLKNYVFRDDPDDPDQTR